MAAVVKTQCFRFRVPARRCLKVTCKSPLTVTDVIFVSRVQGSHGPVNVQLTFQQNCDLLGTITPDRPRDRMSVPFRTGQTFDVFADKAATFLIYGTYQIMNNVDRPPKAELRNVD